MSTPMGQPFARGRCASSLKSSRTPLPIFFDVVTRWRLRSFGCGKDAKAALTRITFGKFVECVADHRSYDRIVTACTLGGTALGDLTRAAGVCEGGN